MLRRNVEKELKEYYLNKGESILILTGARQVGKSYIIRETAKLHFKHYIEINLSDDFSGSKYFDGISSVVDFYLQISSLYGNNLGNVDDTIIFLDEIQTYPQLITLLKALKIDGRYRYIASGSLLEITLKSTFIPIGYIREVKLHPLSFKEFLVARGVALEVIASLKASFEDKTSISLPLHKVILRYFKEYLLTGGLPRAVGIFISSLNIKLMRDEQNYIYDLYKLDARQYDEMHLLKIRRIYDMLPSYMENKVKRVKFNEIESKKGSSLLKYQDEFEYLIASGIVNDVKAVANPKFPLLESSSKNLIKLYFNDVGILTDILYKENINAVLKDDNAINLGSVYETVVAMELINSGHELYYFDSKKVGEVDFLINDYSSLSILPIEVKSGKHFNNFRAIPKLVDQAGNYKFKEGYVLTNTNEIKMEGYLTIMPIYLAMFI